MRYVGSLGCVKLGVLIFSIQHQCLLNRDTFDRFCGRITHRFEELRLGLFVVLKSSMRLYVFRREIREDCHIVIDAHVTKLGDPLRRGFDDSVTTTRLHHVTQHALDEEPSRHRHFGAVNPLTFADLHESSCCAPRLEPRGFEGFCNQVACGCFSVCAGHADHYKLARRMAIPNRRRMREEQVIRTKPGLRNA